MNLGATLWTNLQRLITHMLPGFKTMSTLAAHILIRRHGRSASLIWIKLSGSALKRGFSVRQLLQGMATREHALCSRAASSDTDIIAQQQSCDQRSFDLAPQ